MIYQVKISEQETETKKITHIYVFKKNPNINTYFPFENFVWVNKHKAMDHIGLKLNVILNNDKTLTSYAFINGLNNEISIFLYKKHVQYYIGTLVPQELVY